MICEGVAKSALKDAALAWLWALRYAVLHGPDIAAGETAAERQGYDRLRVTLLPKLIAGELHVLVAGVA